MTQKFKIDFVGIGAPKSGTTWLGHMLEEHPGLCMSEPKEVHFFNDIVSFRSFMKPQFHLGIQWYQNFFKHCKPTQLKGEITPRYCVDPMAAKRIKEHNPDIKIIYCLRNPVDRIWSQFQFTTYFVGKEDRPIMKALMEEPEYLNMSSYYKNLSMYRELFNDEQIYLLWFDDIQQRPDELLTKLFSFLGVDPDFRPANMHKKSNQARISRFVHLQKNISRIKFALSRAGLSGVLKKMKMAGLTQFVTRLNSKPLKKKSIPDDAKNYIIEHLKEDVQQLETLVKRDLSHWLK